MSYKVLARKWRPKNFDQLVGQEHVLRALINALDNDRLHHAYLFTGTRGVGKTTIARILAKCLNCEAGVSSKPCDQCQSCLEVDSGRFIDLIEVDAASRTKVEDTRELLENVQYAPTRGRYKVYLIDEVHMLSGHSFNALLKTLEEPPPHVKFLLATTDPQKLPVTILSRCLQFNLKALSVERISGHLKAVLDSEAIAYQDAAIWALARAADGSMRDALSLTDQAIAYGAGDLKDAEIRDMLGVIDQDYAYRVLTAVAQGDPADLLNEVERIAEQNPDFYGVLTELVSLLHRITIAQIVPEALDDSQGDKTQLLALSQSISPENVQLYYQIALMGRKDLPYVPEPRSGLEMTLFRMLTFRPENSSGNKLEGNHKQHSRASQNLNKTHSPGRQSSSGQHTKKANNKLDTSKLDTSKLDSSGINKHSNPQLPPGQGNGTTNKVEGNNNSSNSQLSETVLNQSEISSDLSGHNINSNSVNANSQARMSLSKSGGATVDSPGNMGSAGRVASVSQDLKLEGYKIDKQATEIYDSWAIQENRPDNNIVEFPAIDNSNRKRFEDSGNSDPGIKNAPDNKYNNLSNLSEETGKNNFQSPSSKNIEKKDILWDEITNKLALTGASINLAKNCVLTYYDDETFNLTLEPHHEPLLTASHRDKLQQAVSGYVNHPVQLNIRLESIHLGMSPEAMNSQRKQQEWQLAEQSLLDDPVVQALLKDFSGHLKRDSIEPVK